jgi:hypothetical protein
MPGNNRKKILVLGTLSLIIIGTLSLIIIGTMSLIPKIHFSNVEHENSVDAFDGGLC